MTGQQPKDQTFTHLMSNVRFKGLLDLSYGGNFSLLGLFEERRKEDFFFLYTHVLTPTASLAWSFQGTGS